MNIAAFELPVCENIGVLCMTPNEFGLVGLGPDGIAGSAGSSITAERGTPYSSSNGLNSLGDIYMLSSGDLSD